MFFLEHGHYAVTEPTSKKSSFVSALKCVLVYFAVAFFVSWREALMRSSQKPVHTHIAV